MANKRNHQSQKSAAKDNLAPVSGKGGGAASFPIVGIGASAGGLEAFTLLLGALPLDTGMGFVLVQHLDPDHESALTQLLARATSLPVQEITNNQPVEPNHVYIIPPDTNLSIVQGVLMLRPRQRTRTPHRPIDSFFESLAQDQRGRAIGIVLSGTASDGTLGLEAIKAEGGITFAQDDSAKYASMPHSAAASGCVDLVLAPAEMATELARIAKHPFVGGKPAESLKIAEDQEASAAAHDGDEVSPTSTALQTTRRGKEKVHAEASGGTKRSATKSTDDGFKKILSYLRNHFGVDFSRYKSTTIRRRIARRLVLNKRDTMEAYAGFLRGNAAELDALYSDMLISVTSFFRNPDMFDALERDVLPKLLKQGGDDPIRVWVLGCSTGQEAYSIAMAFVEAAEKEPRRRKLQVFATDLNDKLLEKARHGLYARNLADDVAPQRLRRFFVEEDGGYRVAKMLREMVVFARQNLISDPPFSRMDIISCRNLLIYLEPSLQRKALPTFHYALKPEGFLVLGASESIGGFTDLFEPVDKKQKIYSRKPVPTPPFHLPTKQGRGEDVGSGPGRFPLLLGQGDPPASHRELSAQREADRITVAQFAPPGVLINADLQILQFRGPTDAYLEPPAGKASFDVLKMTREGLMLPLRAAINQAKKDNKTACKENVRIKRGGATGGEIRAVDVQVIPLKNLRERCFLILFMDSDGAASHQPPRPAPNTPRGGKVENPKRVAELESDLADTRDYLQSVQEQHESANEELQTANEEVQSANEELQSINEELETSKEELESANEELTTVNEEMSNRNAELNRLNNDLVNLQTSTKLAILLLGRDLTIRRFSAEAEKQFDLLAGDVGRPIGNVRHNLVLAPKSGESARDLEGLIAEVIASVREQEREVQDNTGRWYSLRVRPYITLDNKVDGAVLVLVDIDQIKRSEQVVAAARDYAENTFQAVREPLLVLDLDLKVETANHAFYRDYRGSAPQTVGKSLFELADGMWDIPRLRELLNEIVLRNGSVEDFRIEHDFAELGHRVLLFNGRRIIHPQEETERILLAVEDVTLGDQANEQVRQSDQRGRTLADNMAQLAWTCDRLGNVNWYNRRWLDYTGRSFEEMKGWGWEQVIRPDHLDRVVATVNRSNETGQAWEDTFPLRGKDGKYCWFLSRAVPIRDGQGNVESWFGTNTDVTDVRDAEEHLRISEERYRRLFETAHDGILILDAQTAKIIEVNRYMLDLLRYPREHFLGKELWELSVFHNKAENQQAMQELQRDGVLRSKDLSMQDRDGRSIPVEFVSNLYHEGRRPVIQCNIRNISERKRFEDEREAHLTNEQLLRMEAQTANRAKDMFLATLSHEMRTPLNAIVGWMSILRHEKCDEADLKEGLAVIERNTKAQVQLIEDVLDVSRIVSGKLRLEIKPCDLAATVKAGIEVVRAAAEAREITLDVEIDPRASRGFCDAARIQQVVWNLVSNAVKFTPKGGTVRVTLERENSNLRIQVSDNGQGISPDLLPYVFDRFRQADSSTRRKFGGLGLGLSIVKHLVELHGGTAQVQSAGVGKGATFTVRLPIKAVRIEEDADAGQAAWQGAAGDGDGDGELAGSNDVPLVRLDGLRILIVDDEADARRLLGKVLEGAGAIVTPAGSAQEAMDTLSKVKPDVLVSDLGMPDQDGYDLIRQVRSAGHHPRDLPAVALTAFVHKDDARQALLAGFQVHVPKPVDPHDLTAVIASLAGRRGMD